MRIWKNWVIHTLLVWMQNGTATLGNSLAVSYKTKHAVTIWPSNHILGHLSWRNENLCSHKTCTWIFIDTLFVIVLNWDQPRCPQLRMAKQTVVPPYRGLLLSTKRKQTADTHSSSASSGELCWVNEASPKGFTVRGSIYITF